MPRRGPPDTRFTYLLHCQGHADPVLFNQHSPPKAARTLEKVGNLEEPLFGGERFLSAHTLLLEPEYTHVSHRCAVTLVHSSKLTEVFLPH